MTEEIFGPVLTLYRYEDDLIESMLDDLDGANDYALTGAVVGQQPFGGGRKSATNDKAGSALNLLRWCSARTIKETFVSPTSYAYPFMEQE